MSWGNFQASHFVFFFPPLERTCRVGPPLNASIYVHSVTPILIKVQHLRPRTPDFARRPILQHMMTNAVRPPNETEQPTIFQVADWSLFSSIYIYVYIKQNLAGMGNLLERSDLSRRTLCLMAACSRVHSLY